MSSIITRNETIFDANYHINSTVNTLHALMETMPETTREIIWCFTNDRVAELVFEYTKKNYKTLSIKTISEKPTHEYWSNNGKYCIHFMATKA